MSLNQSHDNNNAWFQIGTDGYLIGEDNKWGWITLYVVTIVVAVLGNLLFILSSLCTRYTGSL